MKRCLFIFLTMLLFWLGLGNFIFSQYRLRSSFNGIRQQLILIASNAAFCISAQELLAVPLEETGESSLAYQSISEKLEAIKKTNPILKYVYIMTTTDQLGVLQYVVDADPAPQVITARCPRALPGDRYDARAFPEMLNAYSAPSADKKITSDEWGTFISGYAPIRDASGKAVAILGVDTEAARICALQKNVRRSGLLALGGLAIFLISLLGVFVFKPKSSV